MSDNASDVSGPYDNVFEALELPEPDMRQAKNMARRALREAIEARGLSQRAAAKIMETSQPQLARLLSGPSSNVTFDQLFKLWTALGGRVQVSFIPGEGAAPGRLEAEAPGMCLRERLAPPLERPIPAPKPRRAAAERTGSTAAHKR